jgi:hypothetical protein
MMVTFRNLLPLACLLIAACSKPAKSDVLCQEHTQGFLCNIDATGGEGKTYNVCWDIKVTCADGKSLTANTCQDIGGGGKSTAIVQNSKFSGGTCPVGKVSGIAVENVKMTAK